MGKIVTTLHGKPGILRFLTVLLVTTFVVTACTTTGGSFCDISKPIRLSPATIAQMSDAEVENVLAHNEKGEKLCGWKA